jgi:hypothetical protein
VGRAILATRVVGISSGELWVNVDANADYEETVDKVDEIVAAYPGVDGDVQTYLGSRFDEVLSPVDEPINVRLYGQRLDVAPGRGGKGARVPRRRWRHRGTRRSTSTVGAGRGDHGEPRTGQGLRRPSPATCDARPPR